MEKIDYLIHGKWIITCETPNRILENHALAVHKGKILDILPSKEARDKYPADAEIQYRDHAVMPGFINSHTHLPMNVFRGLADDLELLDWLNNYIWPAEGKWLSHELVYDASLIAMGEMIRCGTTCFNDMYFFMPAIAAAAEKSGMRAHIGMHIIDVPTAWSKSPEEDFAKALDFYQHYKNHALITPTMAPHSTYTVSLKNLAKSRDIAAEYGLKINIHLHESAGEVEQSLKQYNVRPIKRLQEIDMINSNLIAIHMTQLTEEEFSLLKAKGASIVHCPESTMKLASGACHVEKLLRLGINVALGTDGAASNNDLDMIGEMRTGAFLGKLITLDPRAVSAENMLKMATINGAKALGTDKITGSLAADKAADFIAIDLEQLETQPLYNPISQIVYAASRQQVTDVWVAGKQLMKNRQLLTLDEKELLAKAKSWREKIKP